MPEAGISSRTKIPAEAGDTDYKKSFFIKVGLLGGSHRFPRAT
jgi:hypothetical protein